MDGADIRGDFAAGNKTYLNNASVSLMPLESIRAVADHLESYSMMGPDSAESGQFVRRMLEETRRTISGMIRCRPEEIVFTQSTTDGVNAVARGLSLQNRSNIIIRGLGHEHHANYYPWLQLRGKTRIRSLEIDADGLFDTSQLRGMIDKDTALVALSHALYNTGAILPVGEIGEMLGGMGVPYFIDAAQTVGCIGEFDVSKTGCNFMAFNGSKWLCGPMGTGIFYCRRDSADLLEPMGVGGESAVLDGAGITHKGLPERFQAGFRNHAGMAGLGRSAEYLLKYGMGNIRRRVAGLSRMLREDLSGMAGITFYGPESGEERTSIVSFNIRGRDPEKLVAELERRGIILAVREINETKVVRASPHFFNTEDEIQKTADAIRGL